VAARDRVLACALVVLVPLKSQRVSGRGTGAGEDHLRDSCTSVNGQCLDSSAGETVDIASHVCGGDIGDWIIGGSNPDIIVFALINLHIHIYKYYELKAQGDHVHHCSRYTAW
jgi:hypothetical protein